MVTYISSDGNNPADVGGLIIGSSLAVLGLLGLE
jgi:hypothetical protein